MRGYERRRARKSEKIKMEMFTGRKNCIHL
jgi:hypothetical protein